MVTNRVFKVLATNGTQMTSLADNGAGKYLVIDETSATVTTLTKLNKNSIIQLVINDSAGEKVFSDRVKVGDITAYNKELFRAKVEQVSTVTLATPVAGVEYTISIIDKSDKDILQQRQSKRTYTIVAAAGDTATTLGNKFRTQINADVASSVTASGTTTLILTAKSIVATANAVGDYVNQYTFDVFSSFIDSATSPIPFPKASGTIVATTAADYGSGNAYQVRKLEQSGMGYTGITNRTGFPVAAPVYLSSIGTNYDIDIIEFDNTHDTNVVVEGEKRAPINLIVAITSGSSAGLTAILDNIANPTAILANI